MSTRNSLFFSFLDRYSTLAVNIVSSMVIARLLSPAEIGVFSVTLVLLSFVSTVRDMGAGQYIVQEKELTFARIQSVWALQLGLGVGLGCVVLIASYPVAHFYNEPRMTEVMLIVALNYCVNPFGSLTYAWLVREMRFEVIAIMRFFSALCGALVATGMAWQQYGPISLALGSLTSTAVNAIIAIYYRPSHFPWLPSLVEIRRVLAFGSKLTASTLASDMSSSAPELFLGKFQSLAAAGFYSRASGLVLMFYRLFADAVVAVCLPWFARQSRENGGLSESFLKATSYITALGWSFCLGIICLAHPLIRVLYGAQWDQSVDLARLLAVAIAFNVPSALCSTVLLSTGAVTVVTRVTIVTALLNVIAVAYGASHGVLELGISITTASMFSSAIWIRKTQNHLGFSLYQLWETVRKSIAVSIIAAAIPLLMLVFYGPHPPMVVVPLVIGTTGGIISFIAGVALTRHPLNTEIATVWLKIHRWLR